MKTDYSGRTDSLAGDTKVNTNQKGAFRKRMWIALILIIPLTIIFLQHQNSLLEVKAYTVENARIPKGFDGYKIVQISDLHCKNFGKNQTPLIELIRRQEPDVIVITGDFYDEKHKMKPCEDLLKGIGELSPVYYVTGNHEYYTSNRKEWFDVLEKHGVHILQNETISLSEGQDNITLAGVNDPKSQQVSRGNISGEEQYMDQILSQLGREEDQYTVLLSHRPELMDCYERYGADLVLSGHAHGGQIRLPLIGPIIAPEQGFFPKRSSGRFEQGGTTMIVSAGLGTSLIDQRLFCPSQIVCVALKSG